MHIWRNQTPDQHHHKDEDDHDEDDHDDDQDNDQIMNSRKKGIHFKYVMMMVTGMFVEIMMIMIQNLR